MCCKKTKTKQTQIETNESVFCLKLRDSHAWRTYFRVSEQLANHFSPFLTDRKFPCLLCCLASKLESRSDYNSQNEASVWCVFVLACVCALGKL